MALHTVRIALRGAEPVVVQVECITEDNAKRIALTEVRNAGYNPNFEVPFEMLHNFVGVTDMYINASRLFMGAV